MNRLYFYRSLITRIRQYLISKSGTNPVTLTNAVEDKLLQGFSITGNSQQSGTPSVKSPSPIQTTELKKSSNLLHTDFFNDPKTSNGVTIQYLADEDCFLFNGTSTVSSAVTDTSFVISNAKDRPFTISAFYVGGSVTVPSGKNTGASIGMAETSTEQRSNFISTYMSQFKTNNTKICDKQYVKDFWFYFGAGVVFDNYKVKISVTKLENNLCDTVPFVSPSPNPDNGITFTNNGDGSITFNGTCTGAQSQYFLYSNTTNIPADKTKQYFCRTIYSSAGGSSSTYYVEYQLYLSTTFVTSILDYGEGVTILSNNYNYDNLRIKIFVNNGVIVDSVTVRPQIFEIPTNYEPYGKYGLEIKKEGQNYFNVDNFPSLPGNSTYYSLNSNGELVQKEKDFRSIGSLPVAAIIPSGTYTFKSTNSMSNFYLVDLTQNKVINLTSTGQFTVYGETKIGFKSWMEVNTVIGKLQLEQGTEASIYTPYQPPQYNRIWIDKPTLNKNDILTKDKLYVHSKKYLLSDMFDNIHGIPLADYITENNDTWDTSSIHYEDYPPFNTYVANFSGLCDVLDVYINTSGATGTYLKISTPVDGYKVVFVDLVNVSATWDKPSDFQSFLLNSDSYLMLYYSGNVEDSFEQLNVSYIELKPLSAGNNTLTVTNEISPTICQYEYYSSKEN